MTDHLQNGEDDRSEVERIDEIVADIKARHPGWRLTRIRVDGFEDRLFLSRRIGWHEYKQILKGSKGQEDLMENVTLKLLVHPKPDYEKMLDWPPGLVAGIGNQILKSLGFTKEDAGSFENL